MSVQFALADSSDLGRRTVLTVTDDLDAETVSNILQHLDRAITEEHGLVLDLSGITGVDQTLAWTIAAACRKLATDAGLRVIVRDDTLQDVFIEADLGHVVQRDQRRWVRRPA